MDNATRKICLVDGRLYFYDLCYDEPLERKAGNIIYIGKGVIFSIDDVVQKMSDNYLYFYSYDNDD